MLSEEEKERIIERAKFEADIKEQLGDESKPCESLWERLNSKIAILIIGALITGILVPWLQYTQRALEWGRQIRYDNIKFQLEAMRNCLREFVHVSVFVSEAYEWMNYVKEKEYTTDEDYARFMELFTDMQSNRYKQNAKVRSLLIYFPDTKVIVEMLSEHVRKTSDCLRCIESLIRKRCLSSSAPNTEEQTIRQLED